MEFLFDGYLMEWPAAGVVQFDGKSQVL
jgi:hypothetical protein